MAGNIDDTYDEYHVPRLDEIRFGAPGEWVGDCDYASELDVSELVSSRVHWIILLYIHNYT